MKLKPLKLKTNHPIIQSNAQCDTHSDINGFSTGAVWPPSPHPNNHKYTNISVFPPIISLKGNKLIVHMNL